MIPYRYGIWAPSEGRGHRFESCRVRHEFKHLGLTKKPCAERVMQFLFVSASNRAPAVKSNDLSHRRLQLAGVRIAFPAID